MQSAKASSKHEHQNHISRVRNLKSSSRKQRSKRSSSTKRGHTSKNFNNNSMSSSSHSRENFKRSSTSSVVATYSSATSSSSSHKQKNRPGMKSDRVMYVPSPNQDVVMTGTKTYSHLQENQHILQKVLHQLREQREMLIEMPDVLLRQEMAALGVQMNNNNTNHQHQHYHAQNELQSHVDGENNNNSIFTDSSRLDHTMTLPHSTAKEKFVQPQLYPQPPRLSDASSSILEANRMRESKINTDSSLTKPSTSLFSASSSKPHPMADAWSLDHNNTAKINTNTSIVGTDNKSGNPGILQILVSKVGFERNIIESVPTFVFTSYCIDVTINFLFV